MAASNFICIAHRGASGYRPENTLAAFRHALEMGCTWMELDVYLVEGELVVIHDDTLDRTTNGSGKVREATLQELRALDAGDGEQIPLLQEVIEATGHRATINIELKGHGTAEPTVNLIEQYLARAWKREEFLLSSFHHDELTRASALDADLPVGPLFGREHPPSVATCLRHAAYSMNLSTRHANRALIEEAHDARLKVLAYTANSDAEIRRMFEVGVDGVFTNYPDRVFRLMQEFQDGD